jgi:hypothetical protein
MPNSAMIIVCEKALREADGAITAVRIVDVFTVLRKPHIALEDQAVVMTALIIVRADANDGSEHVIELNLSRPSGEVAHLFRTDPIAAQSSIPESARGVNFIVSLSVTPREMGMHQLVLLIDSTEVARAHFTLRDKTAGPNSQQA